MKKIITMTAWRRAHYFKEVIQSIENAEGYEQYELIEVKRLHNQANLIKAHAND